jgi:HEAT repeat protein
MTTEGKRALWFFSRAAALILPMVVIPILTLTLSHGGYTATLDDPNPAVRAAAVRATGRDGQVAHMTRALLDENADVRLIAATYLGRRRERAGPSADALTELLKDERESVRRAAIEALSAIGAPAAPALVKVLSDSDPRVRAGAIEGLGNVGRPKEGRKRSPEERALVIPALEKLQEDEDPDVRLKAARMLRAFRRKSFDGD